MQRTLGASLCFCLCWCLGLSLGPWAGPAFAQQTGTISGKVMDSTSGVLPGVTVEARGDVLPAPRVTVTGDAGEYRLPQLPPGNYTLTFTLQGMQTVTRQARVQLEQETVADVTLSIQGTTETVQVTADTSLIDKDSPTIANGLSSQEIRGLPVGQEYRDLVKLIPGVQTTQDGTRGPSAGGSGQDNVYQFDGVNVTLPLFGTLSAEPASYDIDQVTIIKGGAQAIDFNRSGGFLIDTISKSGTNQFHGQASFQFQTHGMTADSVNKNSTYNQDKTWFTVNGGGPVKPSLLNFYASYYRPTISRDNAANLYGSLPSYDSTRNEGFGKLTLTPASGLLINGSYRGSHRLDTGSTFASAAAATTGSGAEAWLKIATADGSWIINPKSYVNFKYTHFVNETQGRPDHVSDAKIDLNVGTARLDLNNLDTLGAFGVPVPVAGQTAFNAFVQPLIDRYGYTANGVKVGGGSVGYGSLFDEDNFFRDEAQIGYNLTLGSTVRHEIHAGFQMYKDAEDLIRSSNGWGVITVPGGRINASNGQPIYFQAAFQQQSTGAVPKIHSEYQSKSVELNDAIHWSNFTFNAGLLMSNDTLYGQGLRNDASTTSGFTAATGNKYKMLDIPFSDLLQPRVGATWAYNGKDTIYTSFARYYPAASSLPRAAAWDRNVAVTINANFDQNGTLFNVAQNAGSTGKLFADNLTPHTVNEFLVGTARQMNPGWTLRLYGRYRGGSHFWEDTNNNARIAFRAGAPDSVPPTLYVPDLADKLTQIGTGGNGNSYVIAELDGAYTKYYEGTLETEYRTSKVFVHGSYTLSHYYGNFDQDNTTTTNDANVFIGSSFIGDGAGRQLWNFRDGNLRGDRRHLLKVYGYYQLNWNATAGAYAIYQSGQPWEKWSYEPYIALTTSTSDAGRYAEPAGTRTSPDHYQLDLNYTQNLRFQRYNVQLVGDLYNVFDKQTGYNYDPAFHSSTFEQPRNYWSPRIFQFTVRFQF
jgi:hypothetical protein